MGQAVSSLDLLLAPFSAGPLYCQELAEGREGKCAYVGAFHLPGKDLEKWGESKQILKYYPNVFMHSTLPGSPTPHFRR